MPESPIPANELVNAKDEPTAYETGRQFQLWEYRVSHGQMLLRSVPSGEDATNVDVLFWGVSRIDLPTRFDGGWLGQEEASANGCPRASRARTVLPPIRTPSAPGHPLRLADARLHSCPGHPPDTMTVAGHTPGDPPLTVTVSHVEAHDGRLYAGLVLRVGEWTYGYAERMSVNLWTVRSWAAKFLDARVHRVEIRGEPAEAFARYYDDATFAPRDPDWETRTSTVRALDDYAWWGRLRAAHHFHEVFTEDIEGQVTILLAGEPGGQVLLHRPHRRGVDGEIRVTRYRDAAVDRLCERLVAACDELLDRHRPALHATPLPPAV